MYDYVDIYCERTAQGLLNEPMNAVTNLAFMIAAYFLWRYSKKQTIPMRLADYLAVGNLFLIGIGSGLFHTFANSLTEWLDVIPILSFQILWLWMYFTRIFKLGVIFKILLIVVYFFANFGIGMLPDPTHGTISYMGPLLVMLGLGFHYRTISSSFPNLLLVVAGVFIISLTFRTFDGSVCSSLPFGTHFIWHCLNAFVLYGCGRSVVNR